MAEQQTKIFFFEKRNPIDGTLTGNVVDADERTAWSYLNNPRFFYFIGWSDGRFIRLAFKIVGPLRRDENKIAIQPSEIQKNFIRIATEKEIEFAFKNPDKTGPRDMTKMGISGAPIDDPLLLSHLRKLK